MVGEDTAAGEVIQEEDMEGVVDMWGAEVVDIEAAVVKEVEVTVEEVVDITEAGAGVDLT